ncbi:Hsp20/alpha crystallin family protein [Micromonospora sp. HM5-17]|jgi:HSP20 family molecular chaperone IbpA|uniref:Hsp20/alpha crystallin family protein n=1 Tax=Micromonospora sp. HM5-17 TaxID=2487710 RepID=UPI000F4AEE91|nr:Hsp20/alpha crystallin family protein [Micromonospora sp. HM5-17]ROT34095.1 Hsp20/alpha crystallin family protein [Micromonospora sp. HM5-17]
MSTLSLWTRRDPFAEFDALIREAFGTVTTWPTTRPTGFTPAAEIVRDGDDAVVRLELPGLDVEKDVTVEVDRDQLVVRGERRDERAEDRDGRSLREVRYGSFHRSFRLPSHVTADAVSASYDAGVLQVRVAGAYAGTGARRIAITSGTTTAPTLESGDGTAEAKAA